MSTIKLDRYTAHPDGRIEIIFTLNGSGGSGRVWGSQEDMLNETVRRLDGDEQTIAYLMGYWQGRDDDFSNPNIMLGKTLTVDFSAANPIRLQ